MKLDDIDAARGGRFRVIIDGERYQLDGPARLDWQQVLAHLDTGTAPIFDLVFEADLSLRQHQALGAAWARHFDLPPLSQCQRLAYLIDHYHDDLEYELQRIHRVDLDEAWRARRWRRLLTLIDRLPRNTLYSAAVANDPEHVKLLAKEMAARAAEARKDEDGPTGPSLSDWSPELDMLAHIADKLDRLIYTTVQVATNGKSGEKPQPHPRPQTALARELRRAERERRQAAHDQLAARLLRNRRPKAE